MPEDFEAAEDWDWSSDESDEEYGEYEHNSQQAVLFDGMALVAEHSEEGGDWQMQDHEDTEAHPRTKLAREALERAYLDVDREMREKAKMLYPWLAQCMASAPDFSKILLESADAERNNDTEAPSIFCKRASCIHPVVASVLDIDGARRSGFELLLAVALHINPSILPHLEAAAKLGVPLDCKIMGIISQGLARESGSHGVYGLTKDKSFIIGRVTTSTFENRLKWAVDSRVPKVIAAFGAKDYEPRKGRHDFILLDLAALDKYGPQLRFMSAALETMMIAMFASNTPDTGGSNTSLSEWDMKYDGRSFEHLQQLWATVKQVSEEIPEICLPAWNDFGHFYQLHLAKPLRDAEVWHENAETVGKLIRLISPLADTGKYPHFARLRDGAFEHQRPSAIRNRTSARIQYPPLPADIAAIFDGSIKRDWAKFASEFTLDVPKGESSTGKRFFTKK